MKWWEVKFSSSKMGFLKFETWNNQIIYYSQKDTQEEGSIPRRLVAKTCLEAVSTKLSIGKIIEITSNENTKQQTMEKALGTFTIN